MPLNSTSMVHRFKIEPINLIQSLEGDAHQKNVFHKGLIPLIEPIIILCCN